jgi:hypothetical protein
MQALVVRLPHNAHRPATDVFGQPVAVGDQPTHLSHQGSRRCSMWFN